MNRYTYIQNLIPLTRVIVPHLYKYLRLTLFRVIFICDNVKGESLVR